MMAITPGTITGAIETGEEVTGAFSVPSSKQAVLNRAGVQDAGNSIPSGLAAIFRNAQGDVKYSKATKLDTGELATILGPADAVYAVKNDGAQTRNASGYFVIAIEDQPETTDTEDGTDDGTDGGGGGVDVTIIDGFEDEGLTEYNGDTNVGSTGWQFNTDHVINGDVSLENSQGTAFRMVSVSGLNYYPVQGDLWRGYARPSHSSDLLIHAWATADTWGPEGYVWRMDVTGSEFKLIRRSDGTILDVASYSYSIDTWYYVDIDWKEGGDITCTLFRESDDAELATVSATDNNFTEGGIGFGTNNRDGVDSLKLLDYFHKRPN